MSEREDVEALDAVDFVKRLVVAWDCCGTCAGGVLAVHDELVRADERKRLAGEVEAAREAIRVEMLAQPMTDERP